MRLDEIIDALPDVGLRLCNLFQMESGGWRANVRDAGTLTGHQYGDGATALGAMVACLRAAGVDAEEG